jgi:hypothetical protein
MRSKEIKRAALWRPLDWEDFVVLVDIEANEWASRRLLSKALNRFFLLGFGSAKTSQFVEKRGSSGRDASTAIELRVREAQFLLSMTRILRPGGTTERRVLPKKHVR